MRIAFLHPHFTLAGGGSRVVLELASRLASRGHDVTLISQRQDSELIGSFAHVNFRSLPGPLPNRLVHYLLEPSIYARLASVLQSTSPEAVVCNVSPSEYWGAIYKGNHLDTNVLWYCHDTTLLRPDRGMLSSLPPHVRFALLGITMNHWFERATVRLVQRFNTVLANSRFTAHFVTKYYHRVPEIIYPGIDPVQYKPSAIREPYILAVGLLTRGKNFSLVLEALAMCEKDLRQHGIILKIVGDGPARAELEHYVDTLHVRDLVDFEGRKRYEEMPDFYAKAVMTLHPSLVEGFGLVPIESMACGTPVIAALAGGAMETVVDGATGLLVPPTSVAFAEAIRKLLHNSEYAEAMRGKARSHVIRHFTWDRCVEGFERVLCL